MTTHTQPSSLYEANGDPVESFSLRERQALQRTQSMIVMWTIIFLISSSTTNTTVSSLCNAYLSRTWLFIPHP
jgi:hypothetical protein